MDLIRRYQADRIARHLDDASHLAEGDVEDMQRRLVALGPSAIRATFESIARGQANAPAVEVLERLLTNETLPVFVEAMSSPVHAVAEAAMHALSRAPGYDPTQLLPYFGDTSVSKARLENVLSSQMQRIQPVTLVRVLPDLSKDARGSVFRLLEKSADSSVVQDVVRLATHAEWWLRLHAVKLLAKFPDSNGIVGVTRLLRDENPAVRLEAVRTLGSIKATGSIPELAARLRDSDIKVQSAAIESLITIADPSAVPHLLEYLKDDSEYVRRAAVEVLNQVVTPDAVKDLVGALRDSDWWVRVRAADALGSLGGPRVIEAVIGLMRDPDEFVRRYALEILNTVPDQSAVEPLILALDDPDWWVRERAIDALAKTGDSRAVEPLVRVLGRDTRSVPLCIRALSQIADPAAVPPLCRLSESDNAEIRREALVALTRFAKQDLPGDVRTQLTDALQKAGLSADRPAPRPLEVRPQRGIDAGRAASQHRRVLPQRSSESKAAPPSIAGPSPAHAKLLHYQKLEPGTLLVDRFRVRERIGGGGFGTVYLVEDTVVREELVLKILSPQLSLDESMIQRFVQELKLTRRITHRNVIRIYDLLDLDGAHAISMEFFKGRDLGSVLKEDGPLDVARAIPLTVQVLEGLSAAHELGIIHRDVKPANLLLNDQEEVKIVDFGLASVGQTTRSRLTQSGILVGTPEYISPEQITGASVDGRTDLYSLGVVLYEAFSGRQPFSGTNAVHVLFQHLEYEVPPLSEAVPGIPEDVNDLVMSCMSRRPDDRPQSANAVLELLRRRAA